ncbi:hypothetical protein ACFQX7_32655 [Luedemannella flava]
MKLRRFTVVAVAAAAVAATLNVVPASAGPTTKPADQSLRAAAARHNLYIGTAVDSTALNDAADPKYRELVKSSSRR